MMKWGDFAKPEEDITDIDSLFQDFLEPLGLAVVAPGQMERALIGHMHAIGVEHAQVDECRRSLLKSFEDGVKGLGATQYFKGMGVADQCQVLPAFRKKRFDGSPVVGDNPSHGISGLHLQRPGEVEETGQQREDKGDDWHYDHADQNHSADSGVVVGFHRGPICFVAQAPANRFHAMLKTFEQALCQSRQSSP